MTMMMEDSKKDSAGMNRTREAKKIWNVVNVVGKARLGVVIVGSQDPALVPYLFQDKPSSTRHTSWSHSAIYLTDYVHTFLQRYRRSIFFVKAALATQRSSSEHFLRHPAPTRKPRSVLWLISSKDMTPKSAATSGFGKASRFDVRSGLCYFGAKKWIGVV